jgi:3-hydroxyacyl-CoA dehydrogenase
MGMVSLETYLKYFLHSSRRHWTTGFVDFLGIEISEELIRYMNKQCGERFYVSRTLTEKVRANELGVKTGKGFYDYADGAEAAISGQKPNNKVVSAIKTIFVNDMSINHTNILIQMLKKNKTVYFESPHVPYFIVLKQTDPSLYERLAAQCLFADSGQIPGDIDMVYDSSLTTFEEVVQRVDSLRDRFGDEIPIVINSPIHKVCDIAARCKGPKELLFKMNSQRSYLLNTELVQTEHSDPSRYADIKDFIMEITGDCLEVRDDHTSPLMLMILSKFLEAMMILEEGITDMDNIELLLDKDYVFKNIDYFGLDNLRFVVDHLRPLIGEPFMTTPALLDRMLEKGHTGVAAGQGFRVYK